MNEHDESTTRNKMTSGEIMVVSGFVLAIPLMLVTQMLGLGLPGLVIGGILAALLAVGGTSAAKHLPGMPSFEMPSFDWSVLFQPVTIEGDTILLGDVVEAGSAPAHPQSRHGDNLDEQDPDQGAGNNDVDALFQATQDQVEHATIPRLNPNDIIRHTE